MASVQAAVNNYYADPTNRGATGANKGKKTYPLQGTEAERSAGGTPVGDGATPSISWANGTGFFIDLTKLVKSDGTGYLKSVPPSALVENGTGLAGAYTYYVKTDGTVKSKWIGVRTTVGPKSGIYP